MYTLEVKLPHKGKSSGLTVNLRSFTYTNGLAHFKGIRRIAAAGMQSVGVQVLATLFFYLLSVYFSKEDFGIISWCNAIAFMLTAAAGLGMDQVALRNMAVEKKKLLSRTLSVYFLHTLLTAIILFLLLVGLAKLFPLSYRLSLLPWFFGAQALLYIATPFRALLNAGSRFTPYAVISMCSNLAKLGLLLYFGDRITLPVALWVLSGAHAFELIMLFVFLGLGTRLPFTPAWRRYKKLVRESLPQYLSVLFDMALARADWILLGALASTAAVAEYSFAFRAFEMERLPTVMATTLLLPLAARALGSSTAKRGEALPQFKILMIGIPALMGWLATVGALLWEPFLGGLLGSEYGSASQVPFSWLSLALPFQFAINLLWIQLFAAQQYRIIARNTAITAVFNISLSCLLIPFLGALGAAVSFLLSAVLQLSLYIMAALKTGFPLPLKRLGFVLLLQGIFIFICLAGLPLWLKVVSVVVVYPAILWGAKLARISDFTLLLNMKRQP